MITSAALDALRAARADGGRIAYAADPTLATVQVIARPSPSLLRETTFTGPLSARLRRPSLGRWIFGVRGRAERGWAGPQLARTRRAAARAGACGAAFSLAAALCAAAPAGASRRPCGERLAGAASAATGSGGGTPGPAIAKICAEPSTGAVLTTGSHRKPAGAPAAAIRVDQVGYPSGAAKLAEIMTKARPSGDLPGGGLRWVLVRAGSCTVAASGVARQNLGSWSKRYGWVWAARFSQVRAPGRYRVGILGDASAASPWFAIGSAARLYARPLANGLYFFENERDGPDFIHTALRSAPGHLNDTQRDDLPHPAGR